MNLIYSVYILKCSNGQFYTGYSSNLPLRLLAHKNGEVHFTKDKLPIRLIYVSYFKKKQLAYDFERYLKSGSGRAFMKRHLI